MSGSHSRCKISKTLLHERGIDISYETVRFWWNRFGPMFASEIRRKRVQKLRAFSKWQWHVDEVFLIPLVHYMFYFFVVTFADPTDADTAALVGWSTTLATDFKTTAGSW